MNDLDKPFPGCLGRMVNLFDLSSGVAGNKLITDKPHHDGSSYSRSQSDATRMLNFSLDDRIDDTVIVSELCRTTSNQKINGTPVKKLIAQEMSKELVSKHSPSNVVAKLMGLETLPRHQPNIISPISSRAGYSSLSQSHTKISVKCFDQDHRTLDKQMQSVSHQFHDQKEYTNVIWKQAQKTHNSRDSLPKKGRCNEKINERKMALVRKKFMDAKRMSTDEKLHQSKEFQDTLEVLSSNEELFLQFLQEPNSLFSQHLYHLRSAPSTPEKQHITVLRPSMKDNKHTKKAEQAVQATGWEHRSSGYSPLTGHCCEEYPEQPTRIIVLKPTQEKVRHTEAVVPTSPLSPRVAHGEGYYDETEEDDEKRESREASKEITPHMLENSMGHRRDEARLSSAFSNGYMGDDSSFNKSEYEYTWDYVTTYDSPKSSSSNRRASCSPESHSGTTCFPESRSRTSCSPESNSHASCSPESHNRTTCFAESHSRASCSSESHSRTSYFPESNSRTSCFPESHSRASCSPESSVCREAKKRLSERWALTASNGILQEQRHVQRSSSTLGEMLSLSDMKKPVQFEELEPRWSTSSISRYLSKEECLADSPQSLLRSKSVPASSTLYGAKLNAEISDHKAGQIQVPKELKKAKSMKSSLKGKISSLFFYNSKKFSSSSDSKSETHTTITKTPDSHINHHAKACDHASRCANDGEIKECSSPSRWGSSAGKGQREGPISPQAELSVAKTLCDNVNENQNQPSPVSVLESPFDEDDIVAPDSSGNINTDLCRMVVPIKSNLIDKSPPIESIARTLSWDDSCTSTTSPPYSVECCSSASPCVIEEEQNCLLFVHMLLATAGLDNGKMLQPDSFQARWHLPDSPLDPSLRDPYINHHSNIKEANQRQQQRSNRKLIFDRVNETLVKIRDYGSDHHRKTCFPPGSRDHHHHDYTSTILMDHMWAQVKEWVSGELKCGWGGECDGGEINRLVVEMVLRKEVVGSGWTDNNMNMEMDSLGREIEGKLVEELLEETLIGLIDTNHTINVLKNARWT